MPRHREPHEQHDGNHDGARDWDEAFEEFVRQHGVDIAVEEVFHLNPELEGVEHIHQHNHVVVRTRHAKQPLVVCMTSRNWDHLPVEPAHVLMALAADAGILESSEGSFYAWAESLRWNPDSRAAERKFRQTMEMVGALRRLLGEEAYGELLALQGAMADEISEALEAGLVDDDDDEEDWR